MIKAICYKEWIKTRWLLILSALVLTGFTVFTLFNLSRMIEIKGAVHIWEVMIQRDALFIEMIRFVPLIIGIGLGISQFVPEMTRKCLKLTLHLPYGFDKMIGAMLGYGVGTLLILFTTILSVDLIFLHSLLAEELVRHILLTAVVWFLAGIFAYLLTAWIVLEPTWKRRIFNMLIAVLLLKICYIPGAGEAYNRFIPIIILFIGGSATLSFLSVYRFKEGKQD